MPGNPAPIHGKFPFSMKTSSHVPLQTDEHASGNLSSGKKIQNSTFLHIGAWNLYSYGY